VLARIDDSDARRRLEAAEAELRVATAMVRDLEVNLTNAERELRRARDLQRDGVASDQALDQARTSAESLRARLAVAREQVRSAEAQAAVYRQDLENYTVRSPFAGIAVSKDAQPGEMVSPVSAGGGFTRTGISTIVDMGSLEVEVDVNESYIARVVPGQPVEATLDAYPDWHIPSSVRTVIPTADRQKATVKVRISFSQLDPRILPDMGVKVSFLEQVRDGEKNPVRSTVPSGAVRQADGSSVVFVVKDGRAERRAVTIGRDLDGAREILAGVEPGESVVVDGPVGLRDGAKVKVK
jgi:RND family efflux transporter MFP subunit